MSEQPNLKAVTLDAEKQQVSVAWQTAVEQTGQDETEKKLQGLVTRYSSEHIPNCVEKPSGIVCDYCENAADLQIPPGIRVIPMPGSVLIEKETCVTAPRFWKWHKFPWITFHTLAPHEHDHDHDDEHAHHHDHDWRVAMFLAVGCGLATAVGFYLESFGQVAFYSTGAYILAYLFGGWLQAEETYELLRRRIIDVHFLMLSVAAGAAFINHWQEGAILLFLFSLSGALEAYAMDRTKREINSLFKSAPKTAIQLLPNGTESSIEVEKIESGIILRVKPGEQFPVDAVIVNGESAADESNLTGEALPQDKKAGDFVLSGTLNLWGRVDVKVTRPARESALNKIIRLIQQAQSAKAPSQRFTDKFGTAYTLGILALTIVMFFVWWALGLPAFSSDENQRSAFYNAMTLLVVGSPCALVLSIPSTILAGIAAGARHGVLFRGGVAIEKLAEITRVALDKTGTITSGELRLEKCEVVAPASESDLLRFAATLAQNSTHPVSRALVRAAGERNLQLPEVSEFRSHTGAGVSGKMSDTHGGGLKEARLGRRSFFNNAQWLEAFQEPPAGFSETCFECGSIRGRILLKDEVRASSKPLFQKLYRAGLKLTMLTGDRAESAQTVCDEAGLKDFVARLKPEEKVGMIQKWTSEGEKVAMVGDGVNDAPSLAAAHVGVAMGVRGSDAALEQADVVLMQDRLENFFFAYRLSHKARSIIRQNITISLGMVVLLVLAALGAKLPLTLGVLGHEGSTVVVVFNSLRLLFIKE